MKFPMITKARNIYDSGLVMLETVNVSKKVAWFSVIVEPEAHMVKIWYENGLMKYTCDCMFQGVKGIPNSALCSHIIVCLHMIFMGKGIVNTKDALKVIE